SWTEWAGPNRLPQEWHKPMPDPLLVFGISGQVLGEEAFLVKEPPYQKWHHCGDRDKPPVRTKRERRAENVQETTRVHRMANDCVRPGRNDLLIFGDFDGCGGKCVLSIHEGDEIEPCHDKNIADHNAAERHDRPPDAEVKRWHAKKGDESDGRA